MSRRILPLPPPLQSPSTPNGPSRSSSNNSPDDPSKRQYAKRGSISKIACRGCRRRKTKCNAERPTCQNCKARSEKCIYDYEESDRSLTFLRGNAENLAEERNELESVLLALQNDSEDAAVEIFRRLRSGGNLHSLAQQVHAGRLLTNLRTERNPNDPLPTVLRNPHEQLMRGITASSAAEQEEIVRRLRVQFDPVPILAAIQTKSLLQPLRPQSIEGGYTELEPVFGLVDDPVSERSQLSIAIEQSQISAPPFKELWTTVTNDQKFIQHLLRLYFSWQHTFFQAIPEDHFRQDYATGRTNYCSSLLVNAMCAAGCLLSINLEDRKILLGEPTKVGLDFFAEALSHLNDRTSSRLPTVAALSLLAHFEGARGKLSAMWEYCGRSGRMALDLSLHLCDNESIDSTSIEAQVSRKAKTHTFWGCFITDQVTSFTLGRLPQIPINAVTAPTPLVDPEVDAHDWVAYFDGSKPLHPGACSSTFKEVVSLCIIVNSTLNLFFSPAREMSAALLLAEHRKYLRWKENLISIVAATDRPPPHVICLHLLWHSAVLLLFRPFLKAKFTDSQLTPQDICRQSADAISKLFTQHRSLYDLTGIHAFQIQCLLTACTIHITHIPDIASTGYFIDACNSLHDLINLSEWAKSSLSVLKGLVKKWGRILPSDAEAALNRDERDLSKLRTSSASPVSIAPLRPVTQAHQTALISKGLDGKRLVTLSPESLMQVAKRQRLSEASRPELFAPSASQPAPLLRPMYSSEYNQSADKLLTEFEGLDFLSDDWLDPFMGHMDN